MGRLVSGVAAGFLLFNLIAFLVANTIGLVWPAFDAIESPKDYTMPMLWVRLAIGVVAVFASGITAGLVSRRGGLASLILGIVFEIVFLPVHIFVLYEDFPMWYHAMFLVVLIPATWMGGWLVRARPNDATHATCEDARA